MSDPLIQAEQEAEVQQLRAQYTEIAKKGDEQEVLNFIDWLENEKQYVFLAQSLRYQWELSQETDV